LRCWPLNELGRNETFFVVCRDRMGLFPFVPGYFLSLLTLCLLSRPQRVAFQLNFSPAVLVEVNRCLMSPKYGAAKLLNFPGHTAVTLALMETYVSQRVELCDLKWDCFLLWFVPGILWCPGLNRVTWSPAEAQSCALWCWIRKMQVNFWVGSMSPGLAGRRRLSWTPALLPPAQKLWAHTFIFVFRTPLSSSLIK
jgi:hypothetical protein